MKINIKGGETTLLKPTKIAAITWAISLIVFFLLLLSPYNSQETPPDFITIIFILDVLVGAVAFCCVLIFGFLYITKNKNKNGIGNKAGLGKFTAQKLLLKIDKKIIIVGTLIVFLLTLFYWFQIRPSQIKASCQIEADDYFHRGFDREDTDKDGLIRQDSIDWLDKRSKSKYQSCLHRNGL